ncbi:MAG: creatininase family protein [Deltaproteobacteria bacterium]|nr:creatininase family protein [Deltaproteobacteria bacterium]
MKVLELPLRDTRAVLATGAPVFIPVNPVEYHGPHLSLRNDALVSGGLAKDLHARLAVTHPEWPFLEASPIELGFEPCHGPGSRYVAFKELKRIVREAVRALCEIGCKRVVLMTFHGAPLHAWALEEGLKEAARHGAQGFSPLNLVLEQMMGVDAAEYAEAFAHIADEAERAEMMGNLAHDFHAGFFETSMALHYAPESVSPTYVELPPCPKSEVDGALLNAAKAARAVGKDKLAQEFELAAVARGWQMMKPFLGYTGRPHRATAKAGSVFAKAIVDKYAKRAEEIFAGTNVSPTPILAWVKTATMGGRFGASSRPMAEAN